MPKVIVSHGSYGCETGCCGHAIEIDDEEEIFMFDHPYRRDPSKYREWAEELVRDNLGEEHVKDLDWENSVVIDD